MIDSKKSYEKEFWDKCAFHSRLIWSCFNPSFDAKILPDSYVLVGGCGAFPILENSPAKEVINTDISRESLKEFKSHSRSPSLVVADIENLPFRGESFDFVICTQILHHVKLSAALSQLHFVLRKNMFLITVDINKNNVAGALLRSGYLALSKILSREVLPIRNSNEHPLEIAKLYSEMRTSGFGKMSFNAFLLFSPVVIFPFLSFFPKAEKRSFVREFIRALLTIDEKISKLNFMRSIGYSIVCVARKKETIDPEVS